MYSNDIVRVTFGSNECALAFPMHFWKKVPLVQTLLDFSAGTETQTFHLCPDEKLSGRRIQTLNIAFDFLLHRYDLPSKVREMYGTDWVDVLKWFLYLGIEEESQEMDTL